MTEPSPQSRVSAMRATLQTIEAQIARGDLAIDGFEDLKSGIDDLRSRIWAIMAASQSGDPAALERFRLRRGLELCESLARDVRAGALGTHHKEFLPLQAAARHLAELSAGVTPSSRTSG